jgi:ferredoxin
LHRGQLAVNTLSRLVTFIPLGKAASANPNETVLDVARRAGVPLGNSCGGVGVCGRCRIRLVSGAENVSPPTSIEIRTMSTRGFESDERLACLTVVNGDCAVTTTYW